MEPDRRICDLPAALKRMGGNVKLLQQTAAFCREDIPEYLGHLQEAIAEGNADGVRRAAHSIKGMVVNFDASAAASVAQRVEEMGLSQNLRDVEAVSQQLANEVSRLLATLEAELGP